MGAQRRADDHDPRRGKRAKVTLAGRLAGSVDGRPITLDAHEQTLTLRPTSMRQAWSLRRYTSSMRGLVQRLSLMTGAQLVIELRGLPRLTLYPRQGLLVRLLLLLTPTR